MGAGPLGRLCQEPPHEACEPNALVDLLDAEPLPGEHGGDVDSLAMQAEPSPTAFQDARLWPCSASISLQQNAFAHKTASLVVLSNGLIDSHTSFDGWLSFHALDIDTALWRRHSMSSINRSDCKQQGVILRTPREGDFTEVRALSSVGDADTNCMRGRADRRTSVKIFLFWKELKVNRQRRQ